MFVCQAASEVCVCIHDMREQMRDAELFVCNSSRRCGTGSRVIKWIERQDCLAAGGGLK